MPIVSTKEMMAILAKEEGGEISQPVFNRSMRRAGVKSMGFGKWDVAEVLEARRKGKEQDKSKGGVAGPNADLKRRKLELECAKLSAAVDEALRKVIAIVDHDRILSELAQEVRQRIEMIPGSVAPLLQGKTVAQMAQILEQEHRSALECLAENGLKEEQPKGE